MPRLLPALVLSFLCCIGVGRLRAQRVLTGTITDGRQQPVPGALITLQQLPDSTTLQTGLSDSAGNYRMESGATGAVLMRVSATGYGSQQRIAGGGNSNTGGQDFVLLQDRHSLAGITVSSRRPALEQRADRTIYNVASSPINAGADALEAIRKLPGVHVTEQRINIAGKSTVNVLVNDKLVQLSGDELLTLLKSIPADNVSRIELITTPPAKYDAAGSAGLINIVLKKQSGNGLNGNVSLSYEQHTRSGGHGHGSFNYRHNRLNVFGIGTAYNAQQQPTTGVTSYYATERMELRRTAINNSIFNRLQLGADYNISPRAVLGILLTGGNGGPQYTGQEQITAPVYNTATGAPDSTIRTTAREQDRGVRKVGNLNYEWKIDSAGKKLNIDLDYFHRTGNSYRDFTTQSFYENGAAVSDAGTSHISGVQTIQIAAAKADVAWPCRTAVFAFGGKISRVHNLSDNRYEYLQGSAFITDPGKTNAFDYRETIGALYASAQRTQGRWEAQLGLRGEYTASKGYSPTLGQTNTNHYFKIFPTVYLQYKAGDDHVFNLNYSKRIDRPDFWTSNPFRNYSTATTYEEGNPFLQPAFIHTLELSYTLKASYTFKVYAEYINDLHTRVSHTDSTSRIFYFTTANVGAVHNYGGSSSATLHPLAWWECVLEGNAWYAVFNSAYYDAAAGTGYSRPGATLSTNNTVTCNKAKTLLAALSYTYNTSQLSDFDLQYATSILSAGVKLLLCRKQLSLGISGDDLLRGDRTRLRNLYNHTLQNNYDDERALHITAGWKFGNSNIREKRERSQSSLDDSRAK